MSSGAAAAAAGTSIPNSSAPGTAVPDPLLPMLISTILDPVMAAH
jgi:hypothetical protein